MLVRFLQSGPVKFGPATIHGLQGQLADMNGEDLAAAVASGMVEAVESAPAKAKGDPLDHDGDGRKGGSRPRRKG